MEHSFAEVTSGIPFVWFKMNLLGNGEYGGGEGVNSHQTKKELNQGDYLPLSYLRSLTRCGFCRQKGERYE